MENKEIKTRNKFKIDGYKTFRVIGAASIAISALFIALIPVLLYANYSSYGITPPLNDSLQFFYQTNGFLAVFYLAWLIRTMFFKGDHTLCTYVCFWAALIFALLYASAFASNLYYLSSADAADCMAFIITYAPMLCLITSLSAFFWVWEKRGLSKAHNIIFVCTVISVFTTAYYCIMAAVGGTFDTSARYVNIIMVITGALTVTLMNLMLYVLTGDNRTLEKAVKGMTDKQAAIEELAQNTAEATAKNIKDEIELIEEASEVLEKGMEERDRQKKDD